MRPGPEQEQADAGKLHAVGELGQKSQTDREPQQQPVPHPAGFQSGPKQIGGPGPKSNSSGMIVIRIDPMAKSGKTSATAKHQRRSHHTAVAPGGITARPCRPEQPPPITRMPKTCPQKAGRKLSSRRWQVLVAIGGGEMFGPKPVISLVEYQFEAGSKHQRRKRVTAARQMTATRAALILEVGRLPPRSKRPGNIRGEEILALPRQRESALAARAFLHRQFVRFASSAQ